jgi:hypothetical protein
MTQNKVKMYSEPINLAQGKDQQQVPYTAQ